MALAADPPPQLGLRALGSFATVGVALGGVTIGGLCRFYPPAPGPIWMLLPAIGVASLLALLAATLTAYRRFGERPVQWILAGYVLVIALWGTVAVAEQAIVFVRGRLPSTLGVAGV